jgi:hypothetical protein
MKPLSNPTRTCFPGLLSILLFLACSASATAEEEARRPSVLIYTQGPRNVSFPMLKYLYKQGFEVDYTGRIGQQMVPLTWERIRKHNCVIVLLHERGSGNVGEGVSHGNAEVLKRYLESGGGVLLAPDMMHWDAEEHWSHWAAVWGQGFGAWLLRHQTLRENDKEKVKPYAGYFYIRYHYTENVTEHPVTHGVKGVWYPIYVHTHAGGKSAIQHRSVKTFPIRPTEDWTVLLRGSETASTRADVRDDFPHQKGTVMDSIETVASAPPLFAVRDYAKGRMAFFAMNAEYHFIAGMHHNKGGDQEELKGGYNLAAGFDGRKSDFLKLLMNTIRWLAEPSAEEGKLGGYVQELAKLEEPVAPPSPVVDWDSKIQIDHMRGLTLTKTAGFRDWPVFKGIIGAQTKYSGGKGTVAEYKASAKSAGLDYVVFLEDFANLTETNFEQLKKDCAAQSDETILLLPGFRVRDNRGHHLFLFGRNKGGIPWPGKRLLTEDGKMLNMAARKDSGGLPHLGWVLGGRIAHCNMIGYFDLPSSDITRMWNLKLYSAVGLFHYRDGDLVDGMEKNFADLLEVNNSGCNIHPYSISLVSSPQKLTEAAKGRQMLTCVRAPELDEIDQQYGGLKYDYLMSPYVFVSNGPKIVDWSCLNRDYVGHAESFITPNYRFPVHLKVTSESGLHEIKIWDGLALAMRILPNGAKEYEKTFELNHNQQKNLILEVRDVNGGVAITGEQFDRNHGHMHYWCGDRINGALKHGPLYFFGCYGEQGINFVSKGQDSFNLYASPGSIGSKEARTFVSSAGEFEIARTANRPLQSLVSEDAGVYLNTCSMYFPKSEKLWSVWGTYGPLVENDLFDYHQTYVSFRGHFGRANPYNPSVFGIGNTGDVTPGLNITEFRFKRDQVLDSVPAGSIAYGKYGNIRGNKMLVALCRNAKDYPVVINLSAGPDAYYHRLKPFLENPDRPIRIERGGYYAVYGSESGAATRVQYNVGDTPLSMKAQHGGILFFADVRGRKVKAGEKLTLKLLGIGGTVPKNTSAARYDRIADYLGLRGKPGYKLKLSRGRQLPVTVGFCDLQAKDGAVEFTLPRPDDNLRLTLPVRVMGLNDRWSAYCYDKLRNQARPVGVYEGIGYARFDPDYHDLTHAAIGHPVIADDPNAVIVLTILGDKKYPARKHGEWFYGGHYSLQVNNPTDQDLTVTLTNTMDLPDFPFKTRKVIVRAGEVLDVLPMTREEAQARPKVRSDRETRSGDRHNLLAISKASTQSNIVKNGNFTDGIDGWQPSRIRVIDGQSKSEKDPEMLAFEKSDGVGDPEGCLHVRLRKMGKGYACWTTGAVARFGKPAPKGAKIKVSFDARTISGARRLTARRLMGGSGMKPVTLTEEWQHFEGGWTLGYDTPFIVFALLPPEFVAQQYVQQGEFLLDNVAVEQDSRK